ncbi:MAG: sugar kinase [Saprospiraceae bacterium]|nr:sugar kinase [Saprospiraceae bacterium]
MQKDNLVIIKGESRMKQLKKRFNTKKQAKFYMQTKGINIDQVENEDSAIERSVEQAQKISNNMMRTQVVEQNFLPNFSFGEDDVVVVIGHDGLVANTAKYVHNKPILGVNPDPSLYDGILLPFTLKNYEKAVERVKQNKYQSKKVTMAEAKLNDGQRLLAFNDFYIGHQSHKSARYKVNFQNREESQSSSGVIISTGAGSTGWLSSLINMANCISSQFGSSTAIQQQRMSWDTDRLIFIVREPFLSRASKINLTTGFITNQHKLRLESSMPKEGVIFSDGMMDDFIAFNSGAVVDIGIAKEKAILVTA